jgi:tRNA1(Val) A37 N6-methylase TrmN6
MKKSKIALAKRPMSRRRYKIPDYPLQGTKLDLPLPTVLGFNPPARRNYILRVVKGLRREISKDTMTLKNRVPFAIEMRDLRKLLHSPADQYLYTDDKTFKRNVLGKGSPGSTHTFWSRNQMWKMKTKGGDLAQQITQPSQSLIRSLERLIDPDNSSKAGFRNERQSAIRNILSFLHCDKSSGTAFPPFHAKFLADTFLPKEGDGVVVDPCAGWGGRLLGTLCVSRPGHVHYYGIDPEKPNKPAYEGLERRVNIWLKKELKGTRSARIFYKPFEDWIRSKSAKSLFGKVDLMMTSPPYFSAENYNPANPKQSANRYTQYDLWRELFYRKLFEGAWKLLKPGAVFVLNIAAVTEASRLERDARLLARDCGFESAGFYKMAMSVAPAMRKSGRIRHSVTIDGKLFKHEPVFCFRKPQRGRHNGSRLMGKAKAAILSRKKK